MGDCTTESFVLGRNGVSKDEAQAWAGEQRELGERGEFYFACLQCLLQSNATHRTDDHSRVEGDLVFTVAVTYRDGKSILAEMFRDYDEALRAICFVGQSGRGDAAAGRRPASS